MGLESMLLIYNLAVMGAVDGGQSFKNEVSQPFLYYVDSIIDPLIIVLLE